MNEKIIHTALVAVAFYFCGKCAISLIKQINDKRSNVKKFKMILRIIPEGLFFPMSMLQISAGLTIYEINPAEQVHVTVPS